MHYELYTECLTDIAKHLATPCMVKWFFSILVSNSDNEESVPLELWPALPSPPSLQVSIPDSS